MKLASMFPSGLVALAMSLAVTAGSIYVTVSAAATNSAGTTDSAGITEPERLPQPVPSPVIETSVTADERPGDIPLTDDGALTMRFSAIGIPSGELEPAAGVQVTLISTDGTRMTTTTDIDGLCAFGGLTPGLYTIDAAGSQGKLSYGIRAVKSDFPVAQQRDESDPQQVSISMAVILDSALTPSRDANAIESVISSVSVAPLEGTAASSGGAAMETEYVARSSGTQTYLGHQPIRLNNNGSLEGRLTLNDPITGNIAPVKDLTVSFISDNAVVATTTVNPDGSFVQWNLLPGIYSLVVAGRDGIGYIGIDVVDEVAQFNQVGETIPTALRLPPNDFNFTMTRGAGGPGGGQSDGSGEGGEGQGEGQGEGGDQPPPDGGLGGGTGGGSGGGGPGGGESGLGTLLGLAGIGLGAAALADDDNPPASPGF